MTEVVVAWYLPVGLTVAVGRDRSRVRLGVVCRGCGSLVSAHPVDLAVHTARDRAVRAQAERMEAVARAVGRATAAAGP